jgi:hypothetical protein
LAPVWVRRARGGQEPGDLGVALDVAGKRLRELRSLQAGGDERVDAELPLVNEVCAQACQSAVDANPGRRRPSRPLQRRQDAHRGGGRELVDRAPFGAGPAAAFVSWPGELGGDGSIRPRRVRAESSAG